MATTIYKKDIQNVKYDKYGCFLYEIKHYNEEKPAYAKITYLIENPKHNIKQVDNKIKASDKIILNVYMTKNYSRMLAKQVEYLNIVEMFKEIMKLLPTSAYTEILNATPTEFYLNNEIMKQLYEGLPTDLYLKKGLEKEVKSIIDKKLKLVKQHQIYEDSKSTTINLLKYLDEKKKSLDLEKNQPTM